MIQAFYPRHEASLCRIAYTSLLGNYNPCTVKLNAIAESAPDTRDVVRDQHETGGIVGDKPDTRDQPDSFEALFSELASMKDVASSLPPDQRRAYAEKVALSFYAALGGSDTEDEEDDVEDR